MQALTKIEDLWIKGSQLQVLEVERCQNLPSDTQADQTASVGSSRSDSGVSTATRAWYIMH